MTLAGKILVVLNVGLSLIFLSWAVLTFTQATDWGFKDPRKDIVGQPIPSEIKKREAKLAEVKKTATPAVVAWRNASADLAAVEKRVPENHVWYVQQMKLADSAKGAVAVKELKREEGRLVLDAAPWGHPVLDKQVADKSLEGYKDDFQTVQANIDTVRKNIAKLSETEKDLTAQINGSLDESGAHKKGILDLLELEAETQRRVKTEIDYIKPLWVQELMDAQLLIERQQQLEGRKEQLQGKGVASRVP
jgi:hypothetical protein